MKCLVHKKSTHILLTYSLYCINPSSLYNKLIIPLNFAFLHCTQEIDLQTMCQHKNFYIWLLQIIALLGLLALCLWLVLRPKSPSYSIDYISIPKSDQNGSIIYSIEIENPNKDSSIYFDDIVLSFLYGNDHKVGESTISSFHEGSGKTRNIIQSVEVIKNAISNATSELKVALRTRFRYKTWGIKSKFHGVNLQGTLPIGSDGKLGGKKKKYPIKNPSKSLLRSKARH